MKREVLGNSRSMGKSIALSASSHGDVHVTRKNGCPNSSKNIILLMEDKAGSNACIRVLSKGEIRKQLV